MNHNEALCYTISKKIASEPLFSDLYAEQPFYAVTMLEKLKEFLEMDFYDVVERQLLLHSILTTQTNIQLIREIIDFCNNCSKCEDYHKVIMEWTYRNSEMITFTYLNELDAKELVFDKCSMREESLIAKTKTTASKEFLDALKLFNFNSSENNSKDE
jgi:hypothetical protein